METRGVAAVALITEPFRSACESHKHILGLPDLRIIYTPRSLGGLRRGEVEADAEGMYGALKAHLRVTTAPRLAR